MKHPSKYLNWYIHTPEVKYDFRSSGITNFKYNLNLNNIDLSLNYTNGNPQAVKQIAKWYNVKQENIFISTEGTSGQNARIIKHLAEKNPKKNEAIVEYPTYEPLLRQVQEHFPTVKRLERHAKDGYRLNPDELRKTASEKTALLALTNPHAPSGAISNVNELEEIMTVARQNCFYALCDEIYAEFDRNAVPALFSVDSELAIVTTSFTKAYGLGGLKLGIALCKEKIVDELYKDVLNTVGNSPNVVQVIAAELLSKSRESLEKHKQKWSSLKRETKTWLKANHLEHYENDVGVTYWIKLPVKDSYKWVNEQAIPRHSLALVPGTFFLFKSNYKLIRSNMARLGLGNINPEESRLAEALETLAKALKKQNPRF